MANPFKVKQEPTYNSYIQKSSDLIEEAFKTIQQYQTGELKPIKFRRDYLNKNLLGGLFPGNVVGIAGASSMGKSHYLQEMEDDIFNKELNPDCDDYILIRNNYEMSVFKLFLRELKFKLDKKISNMLAEPFSKDEMKRVLEIKEKESNPNVKYFENPQTADEWFKIMYEFCGDHKDKKHIIISIDHIALVKAVGDKKGGIDNLVENMNTLRKIYKNVSYLVLSQLNRNIEERTDAKNAVPRKGDLYQSDFLYQISDVILVVHQPYKWGLQEYMVMGKTQNQHLDEFKKDPSKNTTTFLTKGLLFVHFIKLREDESDSVVFIERIYKPEFSMDYKEEVRELPRMEPSTDLFEDEDTPYD